MNWVWYSFGIAVMVPAAAHAQDPDALPPQPAAPTPQQPPAPPAAPSRYDPAIFQKRIPSDQRAFLNRFAGAPSGDLMRDKEFRKLMHSIISDCTFHYGSDMPLFDAIELVIKGSPLPVQVRDGRYVTVSGRSGPYLGGRGFLWIDTQEGIALGGFYFHPTNGEPTPTVMIFSRQVKEEMLGMSQLPPEFAGDARQWSEASRVPPITTRYFITGGNKRVLLEHDEDFCTPVSGRIAPPIQVCDQMNADAADTDLTAIYYLEQVHYATNATAWMIAGEEHVAWIRVRDYTCKAGPDPLRCHIRMTRERTHMVVGRRRVAIAHR